MNIKSLLAAVAAALAVVGCAAPATQTGQSDGSNITVKDVWARPTVGMGMPGEAKPTNASANADAHKGDMAMDRLVSAAYMIIENKGNGADKLLSASGDVADEIQVHQTKENNGLMMMEEMKDGVEVPANGSLMLKPAGYHIMLMNMNRELKPGDTFTLTLNFQSGKKIPIDVVVREQ